MTKETTNDRTYKYTVLAMGFLEKLLGSKITVDGIENIPNSPVLFVANHFTRSETFVVPYIIHKYTKRQVRCLADGGLFFGALGRFLKSVGAISTKDQKRDLTIISDLVSGRYDWMIYPEGSMIKNKEIHNQGKFISYSADLSGADGLQNRVKTGSAVLALKSELYRADLIEAQKKQKSDLINYYKKEIGIEFDNNLKNLQTHIVPLNITYYPIRPGKNIIQKIIGKIFKKMPAQISEELEIEGNLLLSSNINISFGKSIDVSEYVKITKALIYQIPIITNETKVNLVLKYLKYRLTNQFMNAVYSDTQINIDHLLAAILHFYPHDQIASNHLKALIYLSSNHITNLKKYRLNHDVMEKELYKILDSESFEPFDSAIRLAEMLGIVQESSDKINYLIDKNKLEQKYNFQQIRLENTLQVILNEFLLLENATDVVRRNVLLSENDVYQKSFNYLIHKDLEIFDQDYSQYYDADLSKTKSIGAPFFLDYSASGADTQKPLKSDDGLFRNVGPRNCGTEPLPHKNKETHLRPKGSGCELKGILLVHGYLSAPKEMEEMAKYFNNLGFKIYAVRLKGHGTAPINLEDVKWQDWYDSLGRGYAALKLICDQVFIVGFSTGGLLALMTTFKKHNKIDGIVAINPALKLKDVRAKFASGLHIWNDLLEKFKIEKGQLRYVENQSENSDINYLKNYIKGIEQLELLMKNCELALEEVTCPVLIIQSKNDPVIDSKSSKILLERIPAKLKIFKEIDADRHCIVKGQGSEVVFEHIKFFLNNLEPNA